MNRVLSLCVTMAALVLPAVPAQAQGAYPDKPIHMIVPYAPGGQFDLHARVLAMKMKDILGQNVIIENKPGAATTLGAAYVAQSKNDGYTLLFSGANALAVAPHQFKDLAYKVSDFQPISMVNTISQGFMINAKVIPVRTLAEFVAYVKARPGKFSYGTSGTGGSQHMLGEHLKAVFGLDLVQVGYRGSPEIRQELIAGQIAMAIDGLVAYLPAMEPNGPLLTLAINAPERIEAAKTVPTFKELGFDEMTSNSWGGIFAPAGTPAPVIDKLHKAIVAANNSPDIRERVISDGATPLTNTPAEFSKIIAEDTVKWGKLVARLPVKAE